MPEDKGTPEGPLQFRCSGDRGKCVDGKKTLGKTREILVTLAKPYVQRHAEVAAMLDTPVKVSSLEGDRQEECRMVRYAAVVGKDGITAKATIATGMDGTRWLGRMVSIEPMQPALPLEDAA